MKKLVLLLAVAFSVSLFSCGGAATEGAANDSTANAADSATTEAVDSNATDTVETPATDTVAKDTAK